MINRLKSKSEFSKNVITLMTGTTIAQAIPIAISPILTRIYTPEDFGLLALFVAITATLSSIASGKYELAIMLPEEDEDAINIAALSTIITICCSLLLLFPIVFFNAEISSLIGNENIGVWLYIIPIVVLISGFYNILIYLNNRKKLYNSIAKANVYKSIGSATFQLIFGFLKAGGGGLIIAQSLSVFFANIKLMRNALLSYRISCISRERINILVTKYVNFPKYTLWATLANTLSQNLISIFIPILYDIKTLGFYSLVQRVLGAPSLLIGGAIGQVFYQEAANEKKKTGAAVSTFNGTVKKLLIIGTPAYLILYVFVVDIFSLVFGKSWAIAGEYAQILVPLFFMRFVVSTVSLMNSIFLKNRNGLIFQLTLLSVSLMTLYLTDLLELSDKDFFQLLTFSLSLIYLIFGLYLNRLKHG